jgi:hypothetical protein
MSAFVSSTTGTAPESKARTSSRSNRRWLGGDPNECTRKTTSMFAASASASKRSPSNDARRTKADVRSMMCSICSSSSLGTTQSPMATST